MRTLPEKVIELLPDGPAWPPGWRVRDTLSMVEEGCRAVNHTAAATRWLAWDELESLSDYELDRFLGAMVGADVLNVLGVVAVPPPLAMAMSFAWLGYVP
jgi:hypothetical protein